MNWRNVAGAAATCFVVLGAVVSSVPWLRFQWRNGAGALNADPSGLLATAASVGNPDFVVAIGRPQDSGELWVATEGGLAMWNTENWGHHVLLPVDGLCGAFVTAVRELGNGEVVVGSLESGLCILSSDGSKWEYVNTSNHLGTESWNEITDIEVGGDGIVWVGTAGPGLGTWDPVAETWEWFGPEVTSSDGHVVDLASSRDGNVYCVYSDRAVGEVSTGGDWTVLPRLPADAWLIGGQMLVDDSGTLWFNSIFGTHFLEDGGEWQEHRWGGGGAMAADVDSVVFAKSRGAELEIARAYSSTSDYRTRTIGLRVAISEVTSAAALRDGTVVLGTRGQGLIVIDPSGTAHHMMTGHELLSNWVDVVVAGDDHDAWLVSNDIANAGVSHWRPGRAIRSYQLPDRYKYDDAGDGVQVYMGIGDGATLDGDLWLAKGTHLLRLAPTGDWSEADLGGNAAATPYRCLESGPEASLWLCTDLGVVVVRNEAVVETITSQSGLRGAPVSAISISEGGDAAIATSAGVSYRFADGRWEYFEDVVPIDSSIDAWGEITDIVLTPSREIWFTTSEGIGWITSSGEYSEFDSVGGMPLWAVGGIETLLGGQEVWIAAMRFRRDDPDNPYDGALMQYSTGDSAWKVLQPWEGIGGSTVASLAADSSDRGLWFGLSPGGGGYISGGNGGLSMATSVYFPAADHGG